MSEDTTIKLGNKEIKIGAIHAYTYPNELNTDDLRKIDAWLTSAALFSEWLKDSYTPEKFRTDSGAIWKKYVRFLIDLAKTGPMDGPTIVESAMSYAKTGNANVESYPWGIDEIHDYFSAVFFYPMNVRVMDEVGSAFVNRSGRIVKRIRNYVFKACQYDFPDVFWEFLGGVIRGFACEPEKTVYWRITDNLLWVDGSFADQNSCVMSRGGSYRDGLRMLITSGSYAIQFFSAETPKYVRDGNRKKYTNGIGRAWLTIRKDGSFFIFNGYGTEVLSSYGASAKCTDKIAGILGEYVGIEPQKVNFDFTPSDTIYLNDDGHCQYFGQDKITSLVHSYDIYYDIDIDDDEDDRVECNGCGRRIDMEDSYEYTGDYYCEHCFNDTFDYCYHCHQHGYSEEFVDTVDGRVCGNCAEEYTECQMCGNHDRIERGTFATLHTGDSEVFVCNHCLEEEGILLCDDCGEFFGPELIEVVDNIPYCTDCAEAHKEKDNVDD